MKNIIIYLRERNNIPYMLLVVILMVWLFAYPSIFGHDVSSHIARNTPLMTLGVVLLLIPMFISGTQATLKSDLIDGKILDDVTKSFRNFENYNNDVFIMAIGRLYIETADQRSSAMKNLALGFGLTIISVVLAVNLVFVSRVVPVDEFNKEYYLYSYIYPRFGAIAFIQIIAAFFLRWYGKNIEKISEISDKIMIIEFKKAAMNAAGDSVARSDAIKWMSDLDLISLKDTKKSAIKNQSILRKIIDRTSVSLTNKN